MSARERPIPFSAPMVRAILAGTKTQTRRVVKPVKHPDLGNLYEPGPLSREPQHVIERACPYGAPGDRLWVREAWARTQVFPGTDMVVYREGDNRTDYGGPWKPGIHMFRRDSRITLEVTGVRVERLQAISEDDAAAEGIERDSIAWRHYMNPIRFSCTDPRQSYETLWESINGPGSWDANPWVWVVEFKRVELG